MEPFKDINIYISTLSGLSLSVNPSDPKKFSPLFHPDKSI
jgi:hypothetical protein